MSAAPHRYEFNHEMDQKNRQNDEPSLFQVQPPRHEYHERSEMPSQQYYREETTMEPIQPRNTSTMVREDISPMEYDNRRMSNMSEVDSILDKDEQHKRDTEVFGKHYWEQDKRAPPSPPETEPGLPPRMAEFQMKNRLDDMPVPYVADSPMMPEVKNRLDEIPVPYIADTPMIPTQATQPIQKRPLMNVVRDLVMWRNIRNSAATFGIGLIAIAAFMYFSFITVFAYTSLAVIIVAGSFVFGRQMLFTFQQKTAPHPFHKIMKKEQIVQPEYVHEQLDNVLHSINTSLVKMRNLYLADSLAETLKMALYMYILTYIGHWFNLMTLVMMGWIMAFSTPKVYMMFRPQIDALWNKIAMTLRSVETRMTEMFNQQKEKIMNKRAARNDTTTQVRTEKTTIKKVEKVQ